VYADNAAHPAKDVSNEYYDWGFSYGLNTNPGNGCKDASGKFVGCMVVDGNADATRSFSFGFDDSRGAVDCKYSQPQFWTNSSHCTYNATVTAKTTNMDMPSWTSPGVIEVHYFCDNQHATTISVDDIMMTMAMQCEETDLQPVAIRWVKNTGAVVPAQPVPPANLVADDESVTMDLTVPQGYGNAVTSLFVSWGVNHSETVDAPSEGFEEGQKVSFTATELRNQVEYNFTVTASNIAGFGLESASSVPAMPTSSSSSSGVSTGLIVGIAIGVVVVIAIAGFVGYRYMLTPASDLTPLPTSAPANTRREPLLQNDQSRTVSQRSQYTAAGAPAPAQDSNVVGQRSQYTAPAQDTDLSARLAAMADE